MPHLACSNNRKQSGTDHDGINIDTQSLNNLEANGWAREITQIIH